jgi:hypothetical protein
MVSRHEFIALALFAALGAGMQSQAVGAEPAASPASAAKAGAPVTATGPTASGQRVAVDPATGRMRAPTAEEAAELDRLDRVARSGQRLQRSAAQTTTQQLAGVESVADDGTFTTAEGAKGMLLDDSQMVYSVVTRGADGSLSMECVDGVDAANKLVKRKATPAASKPMPASQGGSYETK